MTTSTVCSICLSLELSAAVVTGVDDDVLVVWKHIYLSISSVIEIILQPLILGLSAIYSCRGRAWLSCAKSISAVTPR